MAVALTPSDVAVLILAGGAGRRLWPLSRPDRPKPLLDWIDHTPMLRAAVARVPPWCPADRVFVSVAADHVTPARPGVALAAGVGAARSPGAGGVSRPRGAW